MPYTTEQRREYNKKYREENKEKIKEQRKKFREKNKEKLKKQKNKYYKENKEKLKKKHKKYREENREKIKEYQHTPQNKKSKTISHWKRQGIICDYEHYYNIYLQQTKCYYCRKEFKNTRDRHLDHDHSITDYYNVRGILCRSCNLKDVYKII